MEDMDIGGNTTVINQILDRVKNAARVELVYGESREVHGKTIIPVALVGYVFGGGEGSGTGPHHNGSGEISAGIGGGGGGMVRVQPVGVLEVTDYETRLVPIVDWTRIITTGLTALGVWMALRTIFKKR
ncbi:MAG TPA: spore germination protein GerW family protein [Dehalococcoidia bacterium]|nr:spore germination protein GerW family protein [Dehalococcoidia bacterium]